MPRRASWTTRNLRNKNALLPSNPFITCSYALSPLCSCTNTSALYCSNDPISLQGSLKFTLISYFLQTWETSYFDTECNFSAYITEILYTSLSCLHLHWYLWLTRRWAEPLILLLLLPGLWKLLLNNLDYHTNSVNIHLFVVLLSAVDLDMDRGIYVPMWECLWVRV